MGTRSRTRLALVGAAVAVAVVVAGVVLAVKYGDEPNPVAGKTPTPGTSRQVSVDWRLEHRHEMVDQGWNDGSYLWSIEGTGKDSQWALGGIRRARDPLGLLMFRRDGSRWREVPVPASYRPPYGTRVSWAGTAAGVWLVVDEDGRVNGQTDVLLHWTGARWERHVSPGIRPDPAEYTEVDAVADDDVWHTFISKRDKPSVRHWDGRSWTSHTLPGDPDWTSGVTALAHDDVWVRGAKDDGLYLAHWSGTRWQEVTELPTGDQDLQFEHFAPVSAKEQWAVVRAEGSDESLYHRTSGRGWREVAFPREVTLPDNSGEAEGLNDIAVDRGRVWLTYGNLVFRRVGNGWEKSKVTTPGSRVSLTGLSMVGSRVCVAGSHITVKPNSYPPDYEGEPPSKADGVIHCANWR